MKIFNNRTIKEHQVRIAGDTELTGFIETCAQGPGFIILAGWAATSDKKRLEQLVLNIEGVGDVQVTQFSHRPDLAEAGIADGYAAFERTVRTNDNLPDAPMVHAITRSGAVPISSYSTRYIPFEPRGSLDWANDQEVSGWVFDPQSAPGKDLAPRIRINGRTELPVVLSISRQDLLPDRGSGEQFFGFCTPTTLVRDERHRHSDTATTIELISSGKVLDRITLPALVQKTLTPPPPAAEVRPGAVPSGLLELQVRAEEIVRIDSYVMISGWLAYKDQSAVEQPLVMRLDEAPPVEIQSLDYRADLARKSIAGGLGAFTVVFDYAASSNLPEALKVTCGDISVMAALKNCRRPDYTPQFSLKLKEGKGASGNAIDLAALSGSPQPLSLSVSGATLPVELGETRSTRKVWTSQGLLPTEFQISNQAMMGAIRALGGQPFKPDHIFSVTLSRGDTALVTTKGKLLEPHKGKLEDASSNRVKGWLAGSPDTPAELDVYVGGTRYATVKADRVRADLVAKGIVKRGGGFQIDVSNPDSQSEKVAVSIHPAYQIQPISGSPQTLSLPCPRPSIDTTYATMLAARARGVSIIIPIYNAADDVEICLKSLCYWTTYPCRIIIIDDCSPDPRIAQILEPYKAFDHFQVYKNDVNLGFTKTVNRGIELAGDDDVVFLNSDTILTPLWLQGLRAAAYSSPRIATATPLSNNAGVFSVPEMNASNRIPEEIGIAGMARLVQQNSICTYPRVPTGNGFCLFVRRTCIEEIGPLDSTAFPVGYGEENDFCMRALHAGFEHVMDDRTYVYHKRSASFGNSKSAHYARGRATLAERYPEYSRLTAVFTKSAEILGTRWRVRRAVNAQAKPLPRVLFVISTETGGTPQTNRDLMNALSEHFEPWLLRCNGSEIKLWKIEADQDKVVEVIQLKEPIEPLIHRSQDYDAALFGIISRHAFEVVHARHLGWHGLGLQAVCERMGIPFILSLHDFYTVCPSIKLLDESNVHCGGKCTETPGECGVELWDRKSFPPLKNQFIKKWQAIFSRVLEKSDALVTTSPFARQTFYNNYPALLERDFRVIPHGRNFSDVGMFSSPLLAGEPLRVLVPGNISVAKGANLIAAIAEIDKGETVAFHILGDHGRLKDMPGLVTHGRYNRDDFVQRARDIKPHIGAVLSIWPETYCHTLTEMWAMGVPVLGMSIGAVGERIEAHGGGWLISPQAAPEETLAMLRQIRAKPKEIPSQTAKVKNWQLGYGRHYTTRYMAAMYHKLYADTLERRRTLRLPGISRNYGVTAHVGQFNPEPHGQEAWEHDRESHIPWPLGNEIEALSLPEIMVDMVRVGQTGQPEKVRLKAIAKKRNIALADI